MSIKLQYPRSTLENTGAYLTFRAYDYSSAPGIDGGAPNIRDQLQRGSGPLSSGTDLDNLGTSLTSALGSSGGGGDGDASGIGSVSLYLPQNLEYSYGANWQAMQFGALGAAFNQGQSLTGALGQAGKIGLATGANVLVGLADALTSDIPKKQNLDLDNLLGASFGITFNDNTLQTFEKMDTRSFDFKYIMVARDADEEIEIRQIIKFFKLAMHPDSTSNNKNNTIFLKYPYIFRIVPSQYKSTVNRKLGNRTTTLQNNTNFSSFLPQTRYCGLKAVNVNYTPNNVISLTPNNFVTAVSLSLSFTELTNLTRKDIIDVEDPTDLGFGVRGGTDGMRKLIGQEQRNTGSGRDGSFGSGTNGAGRPSNPPN